ncbi:MAG: Gfo/Idh/MocA family oxidoreductase [Chloroflexota bacterium]
MTNNLSPTSSPLRLVIVGAGEHASNVVHPALQYNDRITVVGCCDRDAERVASASKRFNAPAFTELSDMLSTVEADAALVIAYPWVQADLTIACLEHGLHVYTEKPLATDWTQVEKVRAAAQAAQRQVAVGFMMRFNPVFQKMNEAINSPEFGTPSLFHARFIAGYRPQTSDLLRVGSIHIFDLAQWLFGPCQEVFASQYEKDEGQVSISVNATFAKGTVASLVLSSLGLWTSKGQLYAEVIGDRNVFSVDNARTWTWQKPPLETIREGITQTMKEVPAPAEYWEPNYMNVSRFEANSFYLNGYYQCIDAFVDGVLSGTDQTNAPTLADGVSALQIALAIEESVKLGKPVTV